MRLNKVIKRSGTPAAAASVSSSKPQLNSKHTVTTTETRSAEVITSKPAHSIKNPSKKSAMYRLRRFHLQKADETSSRKRKIMYWQRHSWLIRRGKNDDQLIEHKRSQMLRKWFDFLDTGKSGVLTVDDLEEPLVSVGLARSRFEVQQLITDARDREDSKKSSKLITQTSGGLCFSNFKSMMISNNKTNSGEKNVFLELFKTLNRISTESGQDSLPILMSSHRRQKFLDAHLSTDKERREEGRTILNAMERSRQAQRIRSDQALAPKRPAKHSETSIKTPSSPIRTRRLTR